MSKTHFLALASVILLSACSNDQPQRSTYGYNIGPGRGPAPNPGGVHQNMCRQDVAQAWNALIASRCNNVQSDRQADACVHGAERFRQRYPGIVCTIAVADTQWGPGNWQAQSWFEINDSVIYGIFYNYGRNSPGRRRGDWGNQPWRQPPHGPQGPNGPRGPQGPQGPNGPFPGDEPNGDEPGHFPIPNGPGEPVPSDDPNSL